MNLTIHRGTHKIGGSCIELSTRSTRLILDIGRELPPVDVPRKNGEPVLPKVSGLYRGDSKGVDAIFISHGHGDHVGLIEAVNPDIPVYIGEKAAEILNVTAMFTGSKIIVNPSGYLVSGQAIKIGDFNITPYLVDHSGFDAYAFVIQANGKCVVYTGDLRDHGRKRALTNIFISRIPKSVDALLIEGTMMGRADEKIKTEQQIEDGAYEFMINKDKPVFTLQSATNIDRLVGMYRAAKRAKRIFVMDIFTAHIVSQLGGKIPRPIKFRDIRVFYPYHLTQRMFSEPNGEELMKQFGRCWISRKELCRRNDYCMLIRDTMLSDLYHINNLDGAGLIYSMWSGYLITPRVKRLMNYARKVNMELTCLHTSGHAGVKTLTRIGKACDPKRVIPIHTEYPQNFDAVLNNVLLLEDGQPITL